MQLFNGYYLMKCIIVFQVIQGLVCAPLMAQPQQSCFESEVTTLSPRVSINRFAFYLYFTPEGLSGQPKITDFLTQAERADPQEKGLLTRGAEFFARVINRVESEFIFLFKSGISFTASRSPVEEYKPSRRNFLKAMFIGTTSLWAWQNLGISFNSGIAAAADVLTAYPVDRQYLSGLSRSRGTAYLEGFYGAVKQGMISRKTAETFLMQVFSESELVWQRSAAIRPLVQLELIPREKLIHIIKSTPDERTLDAILVGLEYSGETYALQVLKEWAYMTETAKRRGKILLNFARIGTSEAREQLHAILRHEYKNGPVSSFGERELLDNPDIAEALISFAGPAELAQGARDVDTILSLYAKADFMWRKRALIRSLGQSKKESAVQYLIRETKKGIDLELKKTEENFLDSQPLVAEQDSILGTLVLALGDAAVQNENARRYLQLLTGAQYEKPQLRQMIIPIYQALGTAARGYAPLRVFLEKTLDAQLEKELSGAAMSLNDAMVSAKKTREMVFALGKIADKDKQTLGYLRRLRERLAPQATMKWLLVYVEQALSICDGAFMRPEIDGANASATGASALAAEEDKIARQVKELLADIKREQTYNQRMSTIDALGVLGTPQAVDGLMSEFKQNSSDAEKTILLKALINSGRGEVVPFLIQFGIQNTNKAFLGLIAKGLFDLIGYDVAGRLQSEIKKIPDADSSGMLNLLETFIDECIDPQLEYYNAVVDDSAGFGETMILSFFARLAGRGELMYAMLASSREMTSHSFPLAMAVLEKEVKSQYKRFDVLSYIDDHWGNKLLPDFLFTVAIYNNLEHCFAATGKDPQEVADLLFSPVRLAELLENPTIFGKLITGIMGFKEAKFKDAFINKIVERAGDGDQRFHILITLLKKVHNFQDRRFEPYYITLPDINSSWLGPQQSWIDPAGVIEEGIFWSTAKSGEAMQCKAFPSVFANGSKNGDYYKNFKGYDDVLTSPFRNNPRYAQFCARGEQLGAASVMLKHFPETGRTIVIYLFTSYARLKESPFYITISRGHSGEGNNNYPGVFGGARGVSHCRSMRDRDQLIRANPDCGIMFDVVGTAKGWMTNTAIYFINEYLGTQKSWGSWSDVRATIEERSKLTVQRYNFMTDDLSAAYAVVLEKMRREATSPRMKIEPPLLSEAGIISGAGIVQALQGESAALMESAI